VCFWLLPFLTPEHTHAAALPWLTLNVPASGEFWCRSGKVMSSPRRQRLLVQVVDHGLTDSVDDGAYIAVSLAVQQTLPHAGDANETGGRAPGPHRVAA
jgi:hypothetical protein